MNLAFPHLATPWALGLLALLPWLVLRHHGRGSSAELGALRVGRLPRRHGGRLRLHFSFYARLAAFAALVVALARPQAGYAWEESSTEGIDIQLVLDISGSMGAEDFQPKNRLTVAKQVLREFVDKRPGDRLGLTIFGGSALTRAPLTTDRQMLGELIDGIEITDVADGTAIGVALANAASRLKDSAAKSKVVVLVTDGVNNTGEIDPLTAASVCRGLGLKIYTIGVGTTGRVPVPIQIRDPETGAVQTRRVLMDVGVDEALLEKIAERTGGASFKATDARTLREIFDRIDRLEKTPLSVKRYVRYRESFQPWTVGALALLLLPLATAAVGITPTP